MRLPTAIGGCILALVALAGEVYLIAAAFDGDRPLASRFGFGFAALLVLIVAQRYDTPAKNEMVSRQHFDSTILRLTQQLEQLREQQYDQAQELKDRIDRIV